VFTHWLIIGSLGGLIIASGISLLVGRIAAARRADYEASVHPQPTVRLVYEQNSYRRSRSYPDGGLMFMIACLLILIQGGSRLIMPDGPDEQVALGMVLVMAAVSLIPLRNDLHDFARKLTIPPVVAADDEGLRLSNWRGTVVLPWREVAAVYTDPSEVGGYVAPEQKVRLHVESQDGRSWRYSRLDFADSSPAVFAELVAFAALRMAPPDSMLLRGGL